MYVLEMNGVPDRDCYDCLKVEGWQFFLKCNVMRWVLAVISFQKSEKYFFRQLVT